MPKRGMRATPSSRFSRTCSRNYSGPRAGDARKRDAEEKDLSLDLNLTGCASLAVLYHMGHADAKAIIAYLKSLPTPIH
jgi:hypothetical protein